MRIAFLASECVPFSKTGGLADVAGALPKALAVLGHEVTVIIPRYRGTPQSPLLRGSENITIPLSGGFRFAAIERAGVTRGVRHCLVACDEFFDREGLYQAKDGTDFPDNAVRFAGFCLAALEFLKRQPLPPDVIHCHDWQTALAPVYLRSLYANDPFFKATGTMLTIHNLGYPGLFAPDVLAQISLDPRLFTVDGLEFFGKVNLLKGGINFSNYITTVSRRYAAEIQTPEFGQGMDGVLRQRASHLQGILNGVDYHAWNPATDKLIPARYTPAKLAGKKVCKKELLAKMGAPNANLDQPTLGIVSRFARQKGFDLIAQIADELMKADLSVVALGTGEPEYEALFRKMAADFPERFLLKVGYDNELAHQIEAGADMFLMPSRYEPCGLNQIYSLKYGTVPLVRATGGLDDTIDEFDGAEGTGFKFADYSAAALLGTLQRALATFDDKAAWSKLMQNGMRQDFSWNLSARAYSAIYAKLQEETAKTIAPT
jgi:starch synthase